MSDSPGFYLVQSGQVWRQFKQAKVVKVRLARGERQSQKAGKERANEKRNRFFVKICRFFLEKKEKDSH